MIELFLNLFMALLGVVIVLAGIGHVIKRAVFVSVLSLIKEAFK